MKKTSKKEMVTMKSKVYFSREITPGKAVDMYRALGIDLPGKVAVKVHTGEKGQSGTSEAEFWRPMIGSQWNHSRVQYRLR